MKSRPILFSAPMVRALLDGSKTQTRRIVKPQPTMYEPGQCVDVSDMINDALVCPYGQPGDHLIVRETWQFYDWTEEGEPCIRYAADNATAWSENVRDEKLADHWEMLSRPWNFDIDNRARDRRWRPSIHMPHWASRIKLEIVSVRVERLQDINESDATAEGVAEFARGACAPGNPTGLTDVGYYRLLWGSINGADSWDANPWVWVVEFKRVLS